jgi:hypothetical protein
MHVAAVEYSIFKSSLTQPSLVNDMHPAPITNMQRSVVVFFAYGTFSFLYKYGTFSFLYKRQAYLAST